MGIIYVVLQNLDENNTSKQDVTIISKKYQLVFYKIKDHVFDPFLNGKKVPNYN